MQSRSFLLTPLLLSLPLLSGVASAQAPAPAAPGGPPASPAPAAPPPAAPPPQDSWTAEPPAQPPPGAAPAAAPPPLAPSPLAPAPGAAGTAAPGAAAAAPPPQKADDYDGPPLLLGKKKQHIGGFGGLTIAYSNMLDRDGVLVGGEGGVLIDHRLSIGGAGYGFSRTPEGPPRLDGTRREFATGYGGLVLRYAAYTDFPIYASLGLLIGGGGIVLADDHHYDDDDWDDDDDYDDDHDEEVRGYFVAQPDLSLHVNATRWLRFGLTFGYRFASPVDEFDYDASAVSGLLAGGNIQAGWF